MTPTFGDLSEGADPSVGCVDGRGESRLAQLQRVLEQTVQAIAYAMEIRDPYTAGHQRRVANLGRAIAAELALPPQQVEGLYVASLLHDVGKIAVPAEILSHPGKLTEHEFGIVRTHPQVGYDILRLIEFP